MNGQQAHEKMLNITDLQGNANQNHSETAVLTQVIIRMSDGECWQGFHSEVRTQVK